MSAAGALASEIRERIEYFQAHIQQWPLPTPSHSRCPGVFKHSRGCGAPLLWCPFPSQQAGPGEAPGYYRCTSFDCSFTEVPQARLLSPIMALEALSATEIKVEAAAGAEDIVAFCGGLHKVLSALGLPRDIVRATEDDHLVFGLQHYAFVRRRLAGSTALGWEGLRPGSLIPEPALTALRGRYAAEREPTHVCEQRYSNVPAGLRKALLPFQEEGVLFGLARHGRMMLADEMGVGKTLQAIALAACYPEDWPLLIIVPASLRLVWAEELERWLPHLRPSTIHVIENSATKIPRNSCPQVVLTSYEMLMRLTCAACCKLSANASAKGSGSSHGPASACTGPEICMAARRWRCVIADESHVMRTSNSPPDARHTEAACATMRRATRLVMLTGTPSLNRPFDLFRQVDTIRPGLLGTGRDVFAQRYCNRRLMRLPHQRRGQDQQKWDNSGVSHARELHALLTQEVLVRRFKKDVMSQLPRKRRQIVRLPPPSQEDWRSLGGKTGNSGQDGDDGASEPDGEETAGQGQATPVLSAAHRTALAKLRCVIEWLAQALGTKAGSEDASQQAHGGGEAQDGAAETRDHGTEAGPKFIVFAHHRDVMSRLADALEGDSRGWPGARYVRIEGSTDIRDRHEAVKQFRTDPAIRVALLSVTAAGTGLDFSAASVVVFVELPHEVSWVQQAEDRAHRHGQTLPVNVYFLLARGTSDERRWQHLNRSLEKLDAVHNVPAPGDSPGKAARRMPGGLHVDRVSIMHGAAGFGLTQHDADDAATTQLTAQGKQADCSHAASSHVQGADAHHEQQAAAHPGAGQSHGAACAAEQQCSMQQAEKQHLPHAVPDAAQAAVISACTEQPGCMHCMQARAMVPDSDDEEAMPAAPCTCQDPDADKPHDQHGRQHAALPPAPLGMWQPASLHEPVASPSEDQCSHGPHAAAPELWRVSTGHEDIPAVSVPAPDSVLVQPAADREHAGTHQASQHAAAGSVSSSQAVKDRAHGIAAEREGDSMAVPPAAGAEASADCQVWFETSQHTGRVHFHLQEDGSQPLGLSIPMDQLIKSTIALVTAASAVNPLLSRISDALSARQPAWSAHAAGALAEATEFVSEWQEQRSVFRNELYGRCLRPPLQAVIGELETAAELAGSYGSSTTRHLDRAQPLCAPPPGAIWHDVHVQFERRVNTTVYRQAFSGEGQRLCILCMKPVPDNSLEHTIVLRGAGELFCGVECERRYSVRAGGGALRRALYALERGVCQLCRLDCKHLLERLRWTPAGDLIQSLIIAYGHGLRAVERCSRRWAERRKEILKRAAPAFVARGNGAAAERLIKQAVDGNAWHADHVMPVYKGGGLCDLHNLRTLCVVCHAAVTKQQAEERARHWHRDNMHNQRTLDGYVQLSSHSGSQVNVIMPLPVQPKRKRAKKIKRPLKRLYNSGSEEDEPASPEKAE